MLPRLAPGRSLELDPCADRPELVAGVMKRVSGERALFTHPDRPRWVVLNRTGARLAERLDGRTTVREIAGQFADECGVAPEIVEEDLVQLTGELYQRGFLETEADRLYRGRPLALTGAFIRVTDACNLRCSQCYVDSFGPLSSKKNELTTEELRRLLAEIKDLGGHTVTLSGGEPLLRPDMVGLVEYAAHELGLRVKLNSNGTLLLAEGVAERLALALHELQLSLDGVTPKVHDAVRGRGMHASTMRGIDRYLRAGGENSLVLSLTLMRSNIDDAANLPVLAESLGVKTVRYLNVVRDGRAVPVFESSLQPTTEQLIAFYDSMYFEGLGGSPEVAVESGLNGYFPQIPDDFRNECLLCPVSLSPGISPQGDVYPCSKFEKPQHKVGSIRTDGSLAAVVDNGGLQAARERITRRPSETSKCSQCTWKGLCQSGCAGDVDALHGDDRNPDGFCEVRDHLYMRQIFAEGPGAGAAIGCTCTE